MNRYDCGTLHDGKGRMSLGRSRMTYPTMCLTRSCTSAQHGSPRPSLQASTTATLGPWQTCSSAARSIPATHERTATDASGNLTVPTDSLTTHGVIVGMTGSGKTGLGVVLIEEVLRAGVPVIAIDPKGDLTNLCLMFPDLAPADFRPWIDEAQAKNAGADARRLRRAPGGAVDRGPRPAGVSPAPTSARCASATDVTIYTPGSTSGVPLNLVGSLQVPADMDDAETVADEIEGYVSGLLGLVGIDADPLSSREHILLSNLDPPLVGARAGRSTCRRSSGRSRRRRSASSACSSSTSSSPRRTAWRWP